MITFICCSINPDMANALDANIKSTIGNIDYEFLAFDNREAKLGICEVYNRCAEKAKYDYLCFLHEDVKFLNDVWGGEIIKKMSEEDCGAIGFAGSVVKLAYPSGWFLNNMTTRNHYRQIYNLRKKKPSYKHRNPFKNSYTEVVTLDGMVLFVSKNVWSSCRFDEELLRGFHGYDVDFVLGLKNLGYKNYVTNMLCIEHFSEGSFSDQWRVECLKVHEKWVDKLPFYASDLSEKWLQKRLPKAYYSMVKEVLKFDLYTGFSSLEILNHIKKHPFQWSSYKLIRLYKKYKLRYES